MGVTNPKQPEQRLLKHQAETPINPNHPKQFRTKPNESERVERRLDFWYT